MRIGSVQPGRPEYYDRNPIAQAQDFNGSGIAPHGFTSRWTYTVPTGKKAYVQSLLTQVRIQTVPAPGGRLESVVLYFPVAGSSPGLCSSLTFGAAVNDGETQIAPAAILLLAGDIANAQTANLGTGGTAFHRAGADIVEFDA